MHRGIRRGEAAHLVMHKTQSALEAQASLE